MTHRRNYDFLEPLKPRPQTKPLLRIGIAPTPDFTLLSLSNLVEFLRHAADESDFSRQLYCSWTLLSHNTDKIRSSCGFEIGPTELFGDPTAFDYVVIHGGLLQSKAPIPDELYDYILEVRRHDVPLIGLCSGQFLFAELGLLNGRKCAVHFSHEIAARKLFPEVVPVTTEPFVKDGPFITCPGGLATLNLAMALVSEHCGISRTNKVLHYFMADSGMNEVQGSLSNGNEPALSCNDQRVTRAVGLMHQKSFEAMSVAEIAHQVGTTKRELTRLFNKYLRMPPGEYWRSMRLNSARWMVVNTDRSIAQIAPALAAGNSVIVKPAEQTSMTALRIAELAHEAGIPNGVLNVVPGLGEVTGKALGLHNDIDMASFTGSTGIGRMFLEYAARSNLKKIVLECGGKNPCIVLDDAEHLDTVADHAVNAVFWNMGENCSSNSRLIVHKDIKDALVERILHKLRDWRMGDPLDPANRLGAIVSKEQYDSILTYIKKGKSEGATLLAGGTTSKATSSKAEGFFIEPTIFDNVRPDMVIARDEIFGPVLAIITVGSAAEAVKIANDTVYGLAASVFTASVTRAHRIARAIRAGTVTVNCYGEGDATTPFGGYKQSGFGGRDNSIHAHDQYTEMKTIWIDVSDAGVEEAID